MGYFSDRKKVSERSEFFFPKKNTPYPPYLPRNFKAASPNPTRSLRGRSYILAQ